MALFIYCVGASVGSEFGGKGSLQAPTCSAGSGLP
jgi:hypothetical protein